MNSEDACWLRSVIIWALIAGITCLIVITQCNCVYSEQVKQTAGMIDDGAGKADALTPDGSPAKGTTKALHKLTTAHKKEVGDPEDFIQFTPETATVRAEKIEEEAASTSMPYSMILLLLLLGERGLKSVGLGLPKGLVWTALKFILPKKKK